LSALSGPDCKGRPIASTRGGVQASVAAWRTLHRVMSPIACLENSGSERGPGTACVSASEQVLFNSDRSMPPRAALPTNLLSS
jgi:hypothetical protein